MLSLQRNAKSFKHLTQALHMHSCEVRSVTHAEAQEHSGYFKVDFMYHAVTSPFFIAQTLGNVVNEMCVKH